MLQSPVALYCDYIYYIMGCAISRVHQRLIDSRLSNSNIDIKIIDNANSLMRCFSDADINPKCIFIFGGVGSSKGEFIWELMQQQIETDNGNVPSINFEYIDVEKLIIENIGKRIKKLTSEKSIIRDRKNRDDGCDSHDSKCEDRVSSSDSSVKTENAEDLKTTILLYGNIVTHNWILGLISKEIERHVKDKTDRVFLISLIPNRINIFRSCLYLKQAPNFSGFRFNYIALNLIKSNSKRKDLDQLATNSGYDEVNGNFINYFRLINKLIEIKVDHSRAKIKVKITKSKNAIKIDTTNDLISFIHTPKKDGMEINITDFQCNDECDNSLIFVIKNEIEIEDDQMLVIDNNDVAFDNLRKFISVYEKLKASVHCDGNC